MSYTNLFASFSCSADGTSTIVPYSDSSCNSRTGVVLTIDSSTCLYNFGAYIRAACNSTSVSQNFHSSGYYDYIPCDANAVSYYDKYPLGTCITLNNFFDGSPTYLVYSAVETATSIDLEYSTYSTADCSGAGSSAQVLLTAPGDCSSPNGVTASISSAVVPPLQSGYRNISLYSDSSCSGNAQLITYSTDGCVPVSSYPFNMKLICNPDNSTTFLFFDDGDITCSGPPNPRTGTIQPSDCITLPAGNYFQTSCVYKPTAQPTNLPTPKPTKTPHFKPTRRPTKTPHFKPTRKPTKTLRFKPTIKPTTVPH